jgi:hypothetical protein
MWVGLFLGLAGLAGAAERPRLDGRAAPRATDLLTAGRLADQAKRRLRLPVERGTGWVRGGGGWTAREDRRASAESEAPSVTIRVAPPRGRRDR